MKKALILASVASMIDQFNMDNIEILKNMQYEVHVIANFKYGSTTSESRVAYIKEKLEINNVKVYDIEICRNIFSNKNIEAYKKVKNIINEEKYDLIHCHSPIGGVIARLSAKKARKRGTKVIYTAHGFHFFKGSPIKNWILFYPVEMCLARYTDVLITINKEDYNRAKKYFKAGNIKYIPGVGIDTEKFGKISINKNKKRRELRIPEDSFLVLSVGELNKNKNHEVVIRAISKLNNPNIYYLICGKGPLNNYLQDLINELGLEDKIKLLGYRSDIAEISKVADVFAFPSFREGLSVALMEAMAAGLPAVCSRIRGNTDLIDNNGGILFDPYNVENVEESLKNIIGYDIERFTEMGKYNRNKVLKFDKKPVLDKMLEIYSKI